MTKHDPIDPETAELERKLREMTSQIFALSEKRIMAHKGAYPELRALAASAMTLQNAIAAFLAVEKLCE